MIQHWLPKKEMTEEDIKLHFITPAIQQKWGNDCITMETNVQLTDGKIELKGNTPVRKKPKRADYVLYQSPYNPIACSCAVV
jgi:type I restriction enzyme R subunit